MIAIFLRFLLHTVEIFHINCCQVSCTSTDEIPSGFSILYGRASQIFWRVLGCFSHPQTHTFTAPWPPYNSSARRLLLYTKLSRNWEHRQVLESTGIIYVCSTRTAPECPCPVPAATSPNAPQAHRRSWSNPGSTAKRHFACSHPLLEAEGV